MNGNHGPHLPQLGLSAEDQRKQIVENICQQAIQALLAHVPPGSQAAVVIKGPPHHGAKSNAVFSTMDFNSLIATIRIMAKLNGHVLDIDTQMTDSPDMGAVKQRQQELVDLAERLMHNVRRALMFLPGNPAAAIRSLRQALGVENTGPAPESVDDADALYKAMLDERIVQDSDATRSLIESTITLMDQWEDAVAARVAAGMSEPVARKLTQAAGLYGMLMNIGTLAERLDHAVGALVAHGIEGDGPKKRLDG